MGEEAGQEVERERGEARQISTLATLLFCQRNAPTQDEGEGARSNDPRASRAVRAHSAVKSDGFRNLEARIVLARFVLRAQQ
jgi:hypothetical protein